MIKRKLFEKLKDHLSHKEISLIIGPRQAGKTTLMLLLKKHLEKKGNPTLFLNLDIEADKRYFDSQETLIRKIELELGKNRGYVFIDEIQRKEDAGVFLKGIYDMSLPYKYIVSGSGSVELKRKIHESLVGRKRVFDLSTLSFKEFVNFRTQYRYENKFVDFLNLETNQAKIFLEDYLLFGGYPRVVLAANIGEKQQEISEIYQSYLEKDIAYLLQVKKTEVLSKLVRVVAVQTGSLVNYSELSLLLGISLPTVKDYLWYLEKTFILHRVTPYFRNIRKEIRKSPVFYFHDMGLRNYAIGTFGNLNMPDIGFVFQNFVFNVLRAKLSHSSASIHFWRTSDGAEIDFVIDFTRELIPIEVKFVSLRKPSMPRSLRSFIQQYHPVESYVVNLTLKETLEIEETKVHFIPFFELIGLTLNY